MGDLPTYYRRSSRLDRAVTTDNISASNIDLRNLISALDRRTFSHNSPRSTRVISHAINHPGEIFAPTDPYSFCSIQHPCEDEWDARYTLFTHYSNQIVRQIYSHFLLKLPSIYFTRISRVFKEAKISGEDIDNLTVMSASRDVEVFEERWTEFVGLLVEEWKTLNIISALLLPYVKAYSFFLDLDLIFIAQSHFDSAANRRCCKSRRNKDHRILVTVVRPHEPYLWLPIHNQVRFDEKHA